MSVGVLTGRPEQEVSGFQGDLLQELSKIHERARKAMRNIAKALWPADSPPGSMEELVNLFKGARHLLALWKISACRQGAREAWGNGEDALHQAGPEPYGQCRTGGARWARNSRESGI